MKIALVIDAFTEGYGGGVATCRLAEGLAKRGHVITVVATKSVREENFFEVKGLCPPGMAENLKSMNFLFGIPEKEVLKKAFADVDLVQIQLPFYLGYGAAKIANSMKKPCISAFHVQPKNLLGLAGKENRFLEFIIGKAFNFFLHNRTPFVQCPSQFAADLLRKNGCGSALVVVSNGIPADYVPAERARPDWFGSKKVIMTVGRHALEKRQPLLIQAIQRSRYADKIQLLLCGAGKETGQLIRMGAQLPVKPFIQKVSHDDKLLFLNTADLFILASVTELESLVCLEAIGCGLPCMVSDSHDSAATQFALDDRFIFKANDADSLAGKIDYWYENQAQLKSIRGDVLAMAERYRFETSLDKMEALYTKAIQAGRSKS